VLDVVVRGRDAEDLEVLRLRVVRPDLPARRLVALLQVDEACGRAVDPAVGAEDERAMDLHLVLDADRLVLAAGRLPRRRIERVEQVAAEVSQPRVNQPVVRVVERRGG